MKRQRQQYFRLSQSVARNALSPCSRPHACDIHSFYFPDAATPTSSRLSITIPDTPYSTAGKYFSNIAVQQIRSFNAIYYRYGLWHIWLKVDKLLHTLNRLWMVSLFIIAVQILKSFNFKNQRTFLLFYLAFYFYNIFNNWEMYCRFVNGAEGV